MKIDGETRPHLFYVNEKSAHFHDAVPSLMFLHISIPTISESLIFFKSDALSEEKSCQIETI